MTESWWKDINPGVSYWFEYSPEGVLVKLTPIRSKPNVITEADVGVVKETVRSICIRCKVDFELISPEVLDLLYEKSYLYYLYPCYRHLTNIEQIQKMVFENLQRHVEVTKELNLAKNLPYDYTGWDYTAPAWGWGGNQHPSESQNRVRDIRDANKLGLKALEAYLRGETKCIWRLDLDEEAAYLGVTQKDKMGSLCGQKLMPRKRVKLPLCETHYPLYMTIRDRLRKQRTREHQNGVLFGTRRRVDDRHRR
jgi:hypothetical protein